MNHPDDWRSLVVTTDVAGREALTSALEGLVASLAAIEAGPRSSRTPQQLHESIWSLDVCPDDGVALELVLGELARLVWANGVNPIDPACVAHLHPPALLPGVVTEVAIAATNQSMDSWDQAPAATELELHLVHWLAGLIGFAQNGTGVMTSGGTASNVLAMTLARSWAGSRIGVDVLAHGLAPQSRRWRILCSDQAHFSIQRAAAQLGLGRDCVHAVATTTTGAMDLDRLDEALVDLDADGLTLMALVGTAGTTDLGAIDPLDELARRAKERGAWFHVDAAVGGSLLLSRTLRERLAGIEAADSVTVDFHKLWWQPFNASALVVAEAERFDLIRVASSYLDRGDELDGMVNLVGRSLDTSRRFDAAKVVASLRTVGRRTLAEMVEYLVDLTSWCAARIDEDPSLNLVGSDLVMCVFDAPGASAHDLRLVQQRLLSRGEMVLGRTEINGRAALKFTFMNPLTTRDDVRRLIAAVVAELHAIDH